MHHVVIHAVNGHHVHEVVGVASPLQDVGHVGVVSEQVAVELQVEHEKMKNPPKTREGSINSCQRRSVIHQVVFLFILSATSYP